MALTKEDLYSIGQLLDTKLEPIKVDIQDLKEDVRIIKVKVENLEAKVENLEVKVENLEAKVENLEARVHNLEGNVHDLRSDVAYLKAEQDKTNLIIENEIRPSINLLVENYVPAAKRYIETAAQIENMQVDIELLKKVVASHSEKLQLVSG